MIKFSLCFGAVRQMKLVGEDPQHKALRARNEARLAALKKANRLTEDRNVKSTSTGSSEQLATYCCAQQQCGSSNYRAQLAQLAGLSNRTIDQLSGWERSIIGQFHGFW